jgi:hypothetical protein
LGKTCFIISSIGPENSEPREKADEKLEFLFKPVLKELGFEPIRADGEDIPGSISRQIVERIINAEMVIADISDLNPNVFYELAIRNAVNKPVIIIKSPTQKPPFDIQDKRAISVDMAKPKIWQTAKDQLTKQIQEAEKNPGKASESILSEFTFQVTKTVKEDKESELLRRVKDIDDKINKISSPAPTLNPPSSFPSIPQPRVFVPPSWNPSSASPIIIPLGSRSKRVVCRKCKNPIDISRFIQPHTTGTFTLNLTCPVCLTPDQYTVNII